MNECASSPCQNDGQCINVPGTYICVCTGYWVGQDCEIDEEECKKKPCHNNGTCVEAVGGAPSCICEPGKKQNVFRRDKDNFYFTFVHYVWVQ